MASSNLLVSLFILQVLFVTPTNSKLFREYIGAGGKNVSFPDVPINPNVDFHFILSFAIDYTNTSSPSPTNGNFSAYWDKENLNPSQISSIKADHPNVKVAMSVAGDSVNGQFVYFSPVDVIQSWCHETESVNSHKYHLILDHRKENYNRKLPL